MNLFVISQIFGWVATFFRASGMLVKNPMTIKWLVSIGNFGWMVSGILTGNVPLIVSNAICLVVMIIEIIKRKKTVEKPALNTQEATLVKNRIFYNKLFKDSGHKKNSGR